VIPEGCDICEQPFVDIDDVFEDDGIYRCTPCNERAEELRSKHPELF